MIFFYVAIVGAPDVQVLIISLSCQGIWWKIKTFECFLCGAVFSVANTLCLQIVKFALQNILD